MTTLVITRGLPASGKSTFARAWLAEHEMGKAVRLNRDDLRRSLISPDYRRPVHEAEELITAFERDTARESLVKGVDVIVDAMNLRLRYAREWATLARECDAQFEVRDFMTDVEECVARDEKRGGVERVGEDVIRGQHEKFVKAWKGRWPEVTPLEEKPGFAPTPYAGTPGATPAVIVDLDGTLALRREGKGARGWWPGPDGEDRCGEDKPNEPVVLTLRQLVIGRRGLTPVFMSGRTEACREQTTKWLADKVRLSAPTLFMRAVGDGRPDDVVKAELFDTHVRDNYDVQLVLDDRDQVVRMWRAMGLTCLQVAPGAF